jgi:hypothetical protein
MALVVYEKSHRSHAVRRALRRVRGFLGGVLVTTSAATFMAAVIIPALLLVGLGSADGSEPLSQEVQSIIGRGWLLAFLITASGGTAGRRLLRGYRGMVLWLRRFRYGEATRVISSALAHIGRSWRVVTLDDTATEAVGVATGLRLTSRVMSAAGRLAPRVARAAAALGKGAAVVCVVGIVVVALWTFYRGGLDGFFALLDAVTRGGMPEPIEARLVWIFAVVLVSEFVVLLATVGVLLVLIPFVGVFTLVGGIRDDVTAAEAAKTRTIRNLGDAEAAATAVSSASRKAVAARLTVLRVETPLWQETVAVLAARADAVLIDVSQVTENVLWEIEHADSRWRARTVFVGHRDLVAPLADPAAIPVPADRADDTAAAMVDRLRDLLDGREVLAYTTGLMGRLRFRRALYAELEDTLPRQRWTWRRAVRGVLLLIGMAIFVVAVLAALDLVRELF